MRLEPGGKIVYLFVQSFVPTVPAAWLTFADGVVYTAYDHGPRVFGLSVTDDQQIAGVMMKIGGSVYLWTLCTVLFFNRFMKNWDQENGYGRRRIPDAGVVGHDEEPLTYGRRESSGRGIRPLTSTGPIPCTERGAVAARSGRPGAEPAPIAVLREAAAGALPDTTPNRDDRVQAGSRDENAPAPSRAADAARSAARARPSTRRPRRPRPGTRRPAMPPDQPSVISDRRPASRYVTGLYGGHGRQPAGQRCCGRNDVVRKANGKNRMKLDVHRRRDYPVFRAIAYGKPVNTSPHTPGQQR